MVFAFIFHKLAFLCIHYHRISKIAIASRVETGSGQPGQILSESSGSDLVYKIFRSNLNLHWIKCANNAPWYLN